MTILVATAAPFSPEFRGGGERYPFVLANELAKTEDVRIAYLDTPGPPLGGAPSVRLPGLSLSFPPVLSRANPLPTARSLLRVRECLRNEFPDLEFVHLHNPRTAMGATWLVLSALAKRPGRFRLIVTDHGARFVPLPAFASSKVDYYAAVSQYSLDRLNAATPRPGAVIPPTVPEAFLDGRPIPGLDDRDIDLLFMGRVAPWKRPDKVFELAELAERIVGRPVQVTIAGSPTSEPVWAELRRLARERRLGAEVRFVRGPSDAEAADLFRRARLHVLLSMNVDWRGRRFPAPELAGATVLEAAALGTPSIVSGLPGLAEQVRPGSTGLVVDPTDLAEAAPHVAPLLDDRGLWEPMSAAACRFARSERTPASQARAMVALLDRIRAGSI